MSQARSKVPQYFTQAAPHYGVQPSQASQNLPWTTPKSRFQRQTGVESNSSVEPLAPPKFPRPRPKAASSAIPPQQMPVDAGNTATLETGNPQGNVWDIYNQRSEYEDVDRLQELNGNMDVLLVFAGLFSGVVAAFAIETYKTLKPDQVDLTNQLLLAILQNNTGNAVTILQNFAPPDYAIRANAFLFTSLITSLMAALAAMCVKQSVGYYSKGLRGIMSKQLRARTRQIRHSGLIKWQFPEVVALIPLTLHISLFFFFAGVIDFLFSVNRIVASVSLSLAAAGAALYVVINVMPLLSSTTPFRSPFTQLMENIARKVHSRYSSSRTRSTRDDGSSLDAEQIDHLEELWFGENERQARLVRFTRTLDVEAIIWLMSVVDKTTERHILEICFEKLMAFRDIALKDPSCFLHPEITRTFRQLASTCVDDSQNDRILHPPRLRRARMLCQFLHWYLNFAKGPQHRPWLREHLPHSIISFIEAFERSARRSDNLEDVVTARVASRRLNHLHTPLGKFCDKCMRDTDIHQALWPSNSDAKISVISSYLTQDIISLTECVTARVSDFRETREGIHEQAEVEKALERTTELLREYREATDFQPLIDHLKSQSPRTFISVGWCSQLVKCLEQPARLPMTSFLPSLGTQSLTSSSPPVLRPRVPGQFMISVTTNAYSQSTSLDMSTNRDVSSGVSSNTTDRRVSRPPTAYLRPARQA